jgi:UDP-glucuronate decarboxylase
MQAGLLLSCSRLHLGRLHYPPRLIASGHFSATGLPACTKFTAVPRAREKRFLSSAEARKSYSHQAITSDAHALAGDPVSDGSGSFSQAASESARRFEGSIKRRQQMSKRVLVTGGAGFLGSHLCAVLLEHGCEVLCVDNFFTGARRNVDQLLSHPKFEIMRHDVTLPLYVEVDEIYNLACPASPIHYQHDPVHTTKTSVMGAINALGLAKRLKARVLQASTSEVYGDPDMHPQPESYRGLVNIMGPRACYDEGKRCAETLFYNYRRQHNLEIRIARIFNTYGPKMHPKDGRVISNFIIQALNNEPITIYGDGSQTRSFCFVDDLITGLVLLMNSSVEAEPINLGNPAEITIKEVAEQIISLTGSRSRLEHRPLPEDDPRQRCPDIRLARELLDWEPRVRLKVGLERTIAYFEVLLTREFQTLVEEAA